jgi:imidazole glycerol-phosphate synthase subunit HisH
MVVIIDYGMGNVSSVEKALDFLNIKNVISNDENIIKNSSAILLPGVGSFSQGMNNLVKLNLVDLLTDEVVNKKKPFLGICLGMHLIFEKGNEPYECDGLGWVKGEVKKLDLDGLKIPHMGWNDIEVQNNKYYSKNNNFDFYFIHSYHVLPTFKSEIAATVNYGIDIVASIQKGNIFATQFHPEKSQQSGLCLLKEFFETIC